MTSASWIYMVEFLKGEMNTEEQEVAEFYVEEALLSGYNITKSSDQVYRF